MDSQRMQRGVAALELVVAVAENDVIGRDNALPWHLPADLRRFKALTLNRHVLMGRKTYESIGKALPQRNNLVLSRSMEFTPGDCTKVGSLEEARRAAGADSVLMVIGGNAQMPRSLFSVGATLASTIATEYTEASPQNLAALGALAVILMALTAGVNVLARRLVNRSSGLSS